VTPACLLYGTGVGGLLLLALRARGIAPEGPAILQAPVLWGLAHRALPALARRVPSALVRLPFRVPLFQEWFARRLFTKPLSAERRLAFFAGYARCAALPDLFHWIDGSLLQELQTAFAAHPERLASVSIWWGDRDRVLGLSELRTTERALGCTFPLTRFPEWGHYPMIDAPAEWARALSARAPWS
jgi:pimeloyl-ACP methyl ester carboxylesterase